MAPLEGLTTYVYRNAYHKYFRKMDKYFTPFIVPHKEKRFNTRELKELSPKHNTGLCVVPQLLTNNADDFLKTAKDITDMGYPEINLNLGCPSKTVVTKKKGSGFLAFPDELDRFLYTIFEKASFKVSIKTRIGTTSSDEFYRLMEIYNQYPIEELTIHPRIQTDFYQNKPNLEIFEYAYHTSKIPLCYNGDLNSKNDIQVFTNEFADIEAVMLGRGILSNPGLLTSVNKETLLQFHNDILEEYISISCGERNVLFKMKELWFYLISLFNDSDKIYKKIKKTEKLYEYRMLIEQLFFTCNLRAEEENT